MGIIWLWKKLRHLNPMYLYCRIAHGKPVRYKQYELKPLGIGGGYDKYYSRCPKCGRLHWEINWAEYEKMEEK